MLRYTFVKNETPSGLCVILLYGWDPSGYFCHAFATRNDAARVHRQLACLIACDMAERFDNLFYRHILTYRRFVQARSIAYRSLISTIDFPRTTNYGVLLRKYRGIDSLCVNEGRVDVWQKFGWPFFRFFTVNISWRMEDLLSRNLQKAIYLIVFETWERRACGQRCSDAKRVCEESFE